MVFRQRKSPFGILPKELVGETIVEDLQTQSLKKRRARDSSNALIQRGKNLKRRRVGDVTTILGVNI